MTLPHYPTTPLTLFPMASWPAAPHQFDAREIRALQAAQATGRPLLVRGEAGTGKSQLAHAAAHATGRAFVPVVVSGVTEASDLHWRFDAIARLGDAQSWGAQRPPSGEDRGTAADRAALGIAGYVQPGPLWWAINWTTALAQQAQCRHGVAKVPDTPAGWSADKGVVLLIDEIDKAEPDVPNGLLEALANGAFEVPLLGQTVKQDAALPRPLIIITTNDERELPAAFLRRCLVLTLSLPSDTDALRQHLLAKARLHFPQDKFPALDDATCTEAADQLIQDRAAARQRHAYAPGLAEYLDLLRAVEQLGPQGLATLAQLRDFYFDKQPADDGTGTGTGTQHDAEDR